MLFRPTLREWLRPLIVLGLIVLAVNAVSAGGRRHHLLGRLWRRVVSLEERLSALTPTPVVVDAHGRVIGPIIGAREYDALATVLVEIDGLRFPVQLEGNHFKWSDSQFGFLSPDCTGVPHLMAAGVPATQLLADEPILSVGRVLPPGNTLYIVTQDPGRMLPILSILGPFRRCNELSFEFPLNHVRPLLPLVNLDDLYTPPFHIE